MQQAIEERFILDVLLNYTTYKLAFKLANQGKEWDEPDDRFAWVKQSSGLPKLRRLSARRDQINDDVLIEIGQLKNLDFLFFSYSEVAVLTSDELAETHISNVGIRGLVKSSSLNHIRMWGCDLDDESLTYFSTMPNLRKLKAPGEFSVEHLVFLYEKFPNVSWGTNSNINPRKLPVSYHADVGDGWKKEE